MESIYQSDYAPVLDAIMPGLPNAIDNFQMTLPDGATWIDSFEYLLPELQVDVLQYRELLTQYERARAELPADLNGAAPAKLTPAGVLTFISLATLASDLLG